MSRKLFAFLLSELVTVRLICQAPRCGGVVELTLDRLSRMGEKCALCGSDFSAKPDAGSTAQHQFPLAAFAKAALAAQAVSDRVQIEFLLPDSH